MYGTTLRGIFPEPKPTHKRNFVKENVKRIKQIQGILPNSDIFDQTSLEAKTRSKKSVKSMSHSSKHVLHSSPLIKPLRTSRKKFVNMDKLPKLDLNAPEGEISLQNEKIAHRAVQTDRPEDICSLYANGTIMYPSAKLMRISKRQSPKKHGRGDSEGIVVSNPHNEILSNEMQLLDLDEKHDFIKENILALKNKTKCDTPQDPFKRHQIGVLPKYLKDRKEEQQRENDIDPQCPAGHVLLPEDERRETLRVLRQSYADRIKELNNMPVSNDTLKRRQRKVAIEEELKKIEEGIKVFQRPKVFVRINA